MSKLTTHPNFKDTIGVSSDISTNKTSGSQSITGVDTYYVGVTLSGDSGDNLLGGGGGKDLILGGAGNDTISPGLGSDNVDGQAGDDLLILDYSLGDTGKTIVGLGQLSIA